MVYPAEITSNTLMIKSYKQNVLLQGDPKLCPKLPRAENRQASEKLTISPSNTINIKWENQILASLKPSTTAAKSIFTKIAFAEK